MIIRYLSKLTYLLLKEENNKAMSDLLFQILLSCIPILSIIITSFLIPYLKTKISATQMEEISKWVTKAVQAAEVLFNTPNSGTEKRDYVIHFIDNIFNAKKTIITKDQIRILLEASLKTMEQNKEG